jgi:hypothetical protein
MRRSLLLLPLLALLAPGAAAACSMNAPRPLTPVEVQAAARQVIDHAGAIIDGEVIRPVVPGHTPALVRVHRQFTGPARTEVEVGIMTSCDVPLVRMGERQRMILTGGPDVWVIRMGMGVGPGVAAAIDRLLGSDRTRDWPYVQGIELPEAR